MSAFEQVENEASLPTVLTTCETDVSLGERRSIRPPLILWAVTTAFWTLSGVFGALNHYQMASASGASVSLQHALANTLVGSWLWVPLTVCIFVLVQRFPLGDKAQRRRNVVASAIGFFAIVLARALQILAFNPWVHWYEVNPEPLQVLLASFDNNLLLYWLQVGGAHAFYYAARHRQREQEARELKHQLTEVRFTALKAQLQPHFLFNTLNSVADLVHRDPDAADRMIVGLSHLLRECLGTVEYGSTKNERQNDPWVALRREAEFIRQYLEIERIRFGERIQIDWQIDPEVLEARTPQWLLQPLVENAVQHGLWPKNGQGTICILARANGERLELEVLDNGVGLHGTQEGVGISLTRARLKQLYGGRASFRIRSMPICPLSRQERSTWTVAQIEIPLEFKHVQPSRR